MADVGSINKVILVGRIASDVKYTINKDKFSTARFTIVTDSISYKGEKKSTFSRVVCYGKRAILLRDYGVKGKALAVEGAISCRSWQPPSGEKRWITEILAQALTFLTSVPIKEGEPEEAPQQREPGEDDPFA